MGTRRIPYLLGHHEIARLFGVARDVPQLWRKRSSLGQPDVVISGSPYWLLPTILALAKPGHREIDPQRLADYKAGIPGGYIAQNLDDTFPLIGIQEVAWIFDKQPSAIGQWRNRGTLASPDLVLSGSPLWHVETILADAQRRGRPVSTEAVTRIRAGEKAEPKTRRRDRLAAERQLALPAPRVFTSDQRSAATSFVQNVLDAGHVVEVRPQRSRPQVSGRGKPAASDPPESADS